MSGGVVRYWVRMSPVAGVSQMCATILQTGLTAGEPSRPLIALTVRPALQKINQNGAHN